MPPDDRQTDQDLAALLAATAARAARFYAGLPERSVHATATVEELRAALGGPLPDHPEDPATVVEALAERADGGIVASAGPRYFGFVVGGSHPAALAADWLAATWDQDAGLVALSPAAAVAEDVAAGWLVDLLGLPDGSSSAFVTGGQMANFVGLAAARHHVLESTGWNVETHGLVGAPPIHVIVGERRHATIDTALRMLGLGAARSVVIACDDQGAMRLDALEAAVAEVAGPMIVCTQVGEVNSGAFDPVGPISDVVHQGHPNEDAWVHVDGAFGLWAAVSPRLRHLTNGIDQADSWATDGHKWLNVPYDSGFAFTRHPASHRAAFASQAAYLLTSDLDGPREPDDFVPEMSRRARGFAVWAALRSLGRQGVTDLIERCCGHARRFADQLRVVDGIEVLNTVVLNQVLLRFADSDEHTRAVIRHVQDDGACWLSGTEWQGRAAMRISVSNWSTTESDVDRSADAIVRAHHTAGASGT
jgi:glutamate/tyrosine decarboxylase-like PLP-dependent enzyme